MLTEVGLLPLPLIQKERCLNFAVRTLHSPNPHPLQNVLLDANNSPHIHHLAEQSPPLSYSLREPLQTLGVVEIDKARRQEALNHTFDGEISRKRLWSGNKEDQVPSALKNLSLMLIDEQRVEGAVVCYTDGSVDPQNQAAGAAAVILQGNKREVLMTGANPSASSMETELIALLLALRYCSTQDLQGVPKILVYTDSMSLTFALDQKIPNDHHELLGEIKLLSTQIPSDIFIQWIPSHVGIAGNEAADRAAKEACNNPVLIDFGRPQCQFKTAIHKAMQCEHRAHVEGKISVPTAPIPTFYKLVNPSMRPHTYHNNWPRKLQQLMLVLRVNSLHYCPMCHVQYCAQCGATEHMSSSHYLIMCPESSGLVKTLTGATVPANANQERIDEEAALVVKLLSEKSDLLHQIAFAHPPIVVCKMETCVYHNVKWDMYPKVWSQKGLGRFMGHN